MMKVDITLKPSTLKGWHIIRETKKCLVVRKEFEQQYGFKDFIGDCHYIPKKQISKIRRHKR